MKSTTRSSALKIAALVLAGALTAGVAPAVAGARGGSDRATFSPKLEATQTPAEKVEKAKPPSTEMVTAVAMAQAQVAAPKPTAPVKAVSASSGSGSSAPVKAAATGTKVVATGNETARAKAILAGLIAKYPILQGTTVSFGDARGYQAIALYKSGRIVISSTHTASLERILNHEVWHIIDWRDNGVIDWGENVPPR